MKVIHPISGGKRSDNGARLAVGARRRVTGGRATIREQAWGEVPWLAGHF